MIGMLADGGAGYLLLALLLYLLLSQQKRDADGRALVAAAAATSRLTGHALVVAAAAAAAMAGWGEPDGTTDPHARPAAQTRGYQYRTQACCRQCEDGLRKGLKIARTASDRQSSALAVMHSRCRRPMRG
jgi:hypothetical protein